MRELEEPRPGHPQTLTAGIFDVDGVLLASPHERAWREALAGFAEPARFTTAMYQAHVAGKPRLSGARAALEALGVPDAEQTGRRLCRAQAEAARGADSRRERRCLSRRAPLRSGGRRAGLADGRRIVLEKRQRNDAVDPPRLGPKPARRLQCNVCGRDLRQGKPNPEIFLLAAAELRVAPAHCFVVEDAPAGIEAARAGGMTALGVARLGDAAGLRAAGADLVVTSLDEVAIDELADGRLCRRPT